MGYPQLFSLDPFALCEWAEKEFSVEQIEEINSIEDMKVANKVNLQLSAYETYFSNLLSYAEIITRQAKRECSKIDYEDMVDRKKIISNKYESLKHQREALSRSVTIYTKMLEEIKYSEKL